MSKSSIGLIVALILSLSFRLLISSNVYHQDILSQAGWGKYISQTGPKDFYRYNVWTFSWPNHPPLTSLYYGFGYKLYLETSLRLHQFGLVLNKLGLQNDQYNKFIYSYDQLVSAEIPYSLGFLICLKILPIFFDLVIGILLYLLAKKSFKYSIIYLLSPFSWYISALWGQTDQMAFLFTILSFLILRKLPILAIIIFYVGISIKPTSVFLIPLFIFLLYKYKIDIKRVVLGGIVCLVINYFVFRPFYSDNLIKFVSEVLLPRIMDRPSRLTTNAYNFWHIFALDKGWPKETRFFWIPANVWAMLTYLWINITAMKMVKVSDTKTIVASFFVVSLGSWMFLTDMLDRYSFAGIVSGLILTMYYPKLLKYWLGLSIIYWLNLFKGWWYPTELYWLKSILTYNGNVVGGLLAAINVIIYLRITYLLSSPKFLGRPHYQKD